MMCKAFCSESGDWLVVLAPDAKGNHTGPLYVVEKKTMARHAGYCLGHARRMVVARNREEHQADLAEQASLDSQARHEIWLGTEGADHLFENGHGE